MTPDEQAEVATYEFEYAIQRALQAVDFSEQEKSGFLAIRHWIRMAKLAYQADTKEKELNVVA